MRSARRFAPLATLVLFGVLALAPVPAARGADETAWLYQPDHVTEIDLRLADAARKALTADPDEYVRATFTLRRQDATAYGPLVIGVKLKGHSSFRSLAGKAAFKLKFSEYDEDQRFLGLETMVLNNMVQDPTMLREVLAYEAFRAAGLASWRTGYSFLRINGSAYGVYLNLESPDAISIARHYRTTRHLFEGGQGIDFVAGDSRKFEVEEGDEDDLGDLEALIVAAKGWRNVGSHANLDQMTRFWAVEKYIGHWDGYSGKRRPNNFYVHSDAQGRFTMLPWGTDQTWERRLGYGDPGGALFNRCLADRACAALYRRNADDVRAKLAATDLAGLATRTAALLAPWQQRDPRRESSAEEGAGAVAALQQMLAARRTDTAWRVLTTARLTLRASVVAGGRVRFSGTVEPRHDGAKVTIERRIGKRYREVGSAVLSQASATQSKFAITLRVPAGATYRAYLAGDAEHLAATDYVTPGAR